MTRSKLYNCKTHVICVGLCFVGVAPSEAELAEHAGDAN